MDIEILKTESISSSYEDKSWVEYVASFGSLTYKGVILINDEEDEREAILDFLGKYREKLIPLDSVSEPLRNMVQELYHSDNDMLFVDCDTLPEDETKHLEELINVLPEEYKYAVEIIPDECVTLHSDFQSIFNFHKC